MDENIFNGENSVNVKESAPAIDEPVLKPSNDKKSKIVGKVILVSSTYIVISSNYGNMWRLRTEKDKDIQIGDKTHI